MQDFDVSTLIFALLAIFVVWKLRSVLGTRTGNERSRNDRPAPGPASGRPPGEGVVVRLPGAANDSTPPAAVEKADRWAGLAENGSAVARGLDAIAASDRSFDGPGFASGAKSAYEMIITAFATGDRQTLRGLLAKDVFDSFSQAISERESRGEKVETTFVSIDKAQISEAELRGKLAQITVRFVSKLITATRDRAGQVIDGDPEQVVDLVDVWTFERDTSARDPNWRLIHVGDATH